MTSEIRCHNPAWPDVLVNAKPFGADRLNTSALLAASEGDNTEMSFSAKLSIAFTHAPIPLAHSCVRLLVRLAVLVGENQDVKMGWIVRN